MKLQNESRAKRRSFLKTTLALFTGALAFKAGRVEPRTRSSIAAGKKGLRSITNGTIGEITIFAGDFVPKKWLLCDGQILGAYAYPSLYTVIGGAYGGDGFTTFALPDLRGAAPMHTGNGRDRGASGGVEAVQLVFNNLLSHNHTASSSVTAACTSDAGSASSPVAGVPARNAADVPHYTGSDNNTMASNTVIVQTTLANTGSGTAHENMMPFLTVNYIICYDGDYPNQY